jgi:oxygen-dependent protoporphyrinogen oxidase
MVNKSANPPRGPRDPRLPKVEGQTVGSFRGGLKTFPLGLAKQLGPEKVKLQWKVTKIEKLEGEGFKLEYDTPEVGLYNLNAIDPSLKASGFNP